jgi:hypothetical protein
MAQHGSPLFETYSRNLRRLYWAEFVDAQTQAISNAQFRASLIEPPLPETNNLVAVYDYHRHRLGPVD